jgi:SAM-dependent methyltransferase
VYNRAPGAAPLPFDPAREEAELREYLGGDYRRADLEGHRDLLEREVAEVGDEDALYRTSRAYLYDLTVFAMSATKLPYLALLMELVPPGGRLLDYGCGIGSDGLMLLEAGYRVEFADFDNPSTAYLRWRLARRGIEAPVHDLDGGVPGGFDAAFSFDVIEHVRDPFAFLGQMERRAALVEVNMLEFEPHRQELHYELPIGDLLRHVARRRLERYRIFHGSSHVVLYRPERAGAVRRVANLARLADGTLRAAVARTRFSEDER